MYTGIVDHCGIIKNIIKSPDSIQVWIECDFAHLQSGESISVDGVCLTVTEPEKGCFRCDISPETCRLTTLKHLVEGQKVNLERSLALSDRLGGHFVSGHVDTVCHVQKIETHDQYKIIKFNGLTEDDIVFLTKKGSISVNGVSLTINETYADGFAVMLIPHTLSRTNLANLCEGSSVNIEFDMLARIVANQLSLINPFEEVAN
jgi:riboflavin synthase